MSNTMDPAFSGGGLMDIGVYCVHVALGLFGPPEQVTYCANMWPNGVDTSGTMLLRYPDLVAVLSCAKDSASANRSEIQGEKGCLMVEGSLGKIPKLLLLQDGRIEDVSVPQGEGHMVYEISAFAEAVRRRDYAFARRRLRHSGEVIRVLDEARKSAGIHFPADEA